MTVLSHWRIRTNRNVKSYLSRIWLWKQGATQLCDGNQNPSNKEDGDDVSDDDEDEGDEKNPDCPTIKMSKYEKRRLRNRWKDALIIKLIDHMVGYTYLVQRIKALWRISSRMDVIDVGHGVYVVRFANIAERERALYGGPWIIADHYLAVTTWFHNFDPETYSISKLAVWVRFPNMPMEYYDPFGFWESVSELEPH